MDEPRCPGPDSRRGFACLSILPPSIAATVPHFLYFSFTADTTQPDFLGTGQSALRQLWRNIKRRYNNSLNLAFGTSGRWVVVF